MLKGIDVSHHNGFPDFQKAKAAGIRFVYVKASEGVTYVDPNFQPNMMNALKAGLPVGAYHFARPGHNSPEAEAEHFIETISVFKYTLLPVLDLEVDEGKSGAYLYDWARAFAGRVKEKTGHNCLFYSGVWFLNKFPELKRLNDLPVWIAIYRSTVPAFGWDRWTMWQYTDCENVPGVGECDCNYIRDLNDILINREESAPSFKRVLKLADPLMRGDDVKRLQQRLNIKADGIFGPLTEQAVMNWQRVHDENGNVVKPGKGLEVDGIVGPKTWAALFK